MAQTTTSGLSRILMVASFVLIGGFVYWLNVTAKPTELLVVQNEENAGDSLALAVSLGEFTGDPANFDGRLIRMMGIRVASKIGDTAFWFLLSNQTPYLVRLDTVLVARGMEVLTGDNGIVMGTVHMMSDSVLDAWEAAGAFSDPVQRFEAEFATSFIEATSLDLQAAPPADPGSGSAG